MPSLTNDLPDDQEAVLAAKGTSESTVTGGVRTPCYSTIWRPIGFGIRGKRPRTR